MYVNSFGNVFHCIITLVTSEGTLTIREECNKTTFMGQWQIIDGTGAYATLRGNAKVMMPRGFEVLEGSYLLGTIVHIIDDLLHKKIPCKTMSYG